MDFDDLVGNVNVEVNKYLGYMEITNAEALGLDARAGSELFVGPDGMAVESRYDRALRYYGGFEYINDMDRIQLGDYVFYSNRATRVSECLDYFLEEVEYGN